MSTHANISLLLKKRNIIKTVYLHYDGYLDNAGMLLYKYYNNYLDIKNLIKMGGISVLKFNIEKSIFYYRDRNEDLKIYETSISNRELDNIYKNYIINADIFIDYHYLFINNEWYVYSKFLDSGLRFVKLYETLKLMGKIK